MPVNTYLVGNDGDVTITRGGTSQTIMKVQSFTANLSRVSSDLTGFGDTGRRRRLGIIDLTGSMNAVIGLDTTAGTTTSTFFTSTNDWPDTSNIVNVTLVFWTGTAATNQAKIVSTAVFSQYSFSSNKTGDATVSANFENANGVAPVVTWYI